MERCDDLSSASLLGERPQLPEWVIVKHVVSIGLNHHMAYEFDHRILGRYGAAVRKKICPVRMGSGQRSARVGKGFSPQKFIQKFCRPGIQVNLQVHFHS